MKTVFTLSNNMIKVLNTENRLFIHQFLPGLRTFKWLYTYSEDNKAMFVEVFKKFQESGIWKRLSLSFQAFQLFQTARRVLTSANRKNNTYERTTKTFPTYPPRFPAYTLESYASIRFKLKSLLLCAQHATKCL